jgi:hypothetical protein
MKPPARLPPSAPRRDPRPARAFLDRVEGKTAVLLLDNQEVIYLPARLLPEGAKEGRWLELRLGLGREPEKAQTTRRRR